MLAEVTQGWSGLMLDYAAVFAPMVATLVKRKAELRKVLLSPMVAAPMTLAAGIGTIVMEPAMRAIEMGGSLQLAVGLGVHAAVGYCSGRLATRSPLVSQFYRRGTLVVDSRDKTGSRSSGPSRSRLLARSRTPWSGLTLAGRPVPAEDEAKHFKLIGTTGTGKSTAIRELLAGALARGDRAILADPDGGYLERFYDEKRGDVILSPFEPKAAKWDLYGEITSDYDIEQLARSLIPEGEGSERSWNGYGRTFFSAVVNQTRDGGIGDVKELYHVLVTADAKELKTLVEGTSAQPFLHEKNVTMFGSVRSVTSSAVSALKYIGQQEGPPLSVRKWVQSGKGVLFIPYKAGQIAALRSVVSAWMRLAIFETMNKEEGGKPLWFVVDELDALGQIDGLKDALARLRKFGGRCVLGFQSISQVSGTYGHAEAQTIVENCGNSLILRCSASERGGTASFASQLIGKREVMRISESRSRQAMQWLPSVTLSEHLTIEPAVLDSQIEQLPDLQGYLKFASSPEWRRVALMPGAASQACGMARRVWRAFKKSVAHDSHEVTNGLER